MKNMVDISRRHMLKASGLVGLGLGASKLVGASLDQMCVETPVQPEGPFYPVRDQSDKNNDLTMVQGKTERALGTIIYVSGKVVDQNCTSVSGATVEIWQACQTGRYNHPGDNNNSSPLDPNFQYWGIDVTDNDGLYSFKTIIPGHYYAGTNWIRPPHIHFKVHKLGIMELITQMYFMGNQYNDGDLILKKIPQNNRASVVRELTPRPKENGRDVFAVNFDIAVESLF